MTHIKTLNGATLKQSAAHGGCGECQTSCQLSLIHISSLDWGRSGSSK